MIASAGGLRGYVSSDGIVCNPVRETPLVTSGPFDSHNTLLWDDEHGRYVIYGGWGEFTTRPIVFAGSRLELNYCTSAGGGLRVELQDETGAPLPGVGMKDCPRIVGDRTGGDVRWDPEADLSHWAGRPVRMRVRLRDAHLYAFRFL